MFEFDNIVKLFVVIIFLPFKRENRMCDMTLSIRDVSFVNDSFTMIESLERPVIDSVTSRDPINHMTRNTKSSPACLTEFEPKTTIGSLKIKMKNEPNELFSRIASRCVVRIKPRSVQ